MYHNVDIVGDKCVPVVNFLLAGQKNRQNILLGFTEP